MEIQATRNVPAVAEIAKPIPAEVAAENREVVQAVKALSAAEMFGQDSELLYQMDQRAHRLIIRLVNRKTGELIRQIPSEEILRLGRQLEHAITEIALPADEGSEEHNV